MASVGLRVDGQVRANPMVGICMLVVLDIDTVYLHGTPAQVRAFANSILDALPEPEVVAVSEPYEPTSMERLNDPENAPSDESEEPEMALAPGSDLLHG